MPTLVNLLPCQHKAVSAALREHMPAAKEYVANLKPHCREMYTVGKRTETGTEGSYGPHSTISAYHTSVVVTAADLIQYYCTPPHLS
jgi:hypothetical protein